MSERPLRIAILAAGAGGMICGSCMRDTTLARALRRRGHDAVLVPLYTPLRTDESAATDAAAGMTGEVFYGGVNVYLQHANGLFRHTPRAVDWLLDRPWLLNRAARYGSTTPPEKLGGLTRDVLLGEEGSTRKEVRRLVDFLRALKVDIVSLPNLMFVGVARALRKALGVPVVCELTGEDVFLEAMTEADQAACQEAIRSQADEVHLVATSRHYARKMAAYLGLDEGRITVVHPGVPADLIGGNDGGRGVTVGYFARICPEKGFGALVETLPAVAAAVPDVGLSYGGYLGPQHAQWHADQQARAREVLGGRVQHVGEVDLAGKLALLDAAGVFCVPAVFEEAKGIYVLEAMARGVPVVLPRRGSFAELLAHGGGVLVESGDAGALASAMAGVLRDESAARQMGRRGREVVREEFTDDRMAERMVGFYRSALA